VYWLAFRDFAVFPDGLVPGNAKQSAEIGHETFIGSLTAAVGR
jgi:hypothetical protein